MSEPIIESSGNVFSDLGFESPEAVILQLRAKLLSDLRLYLASSGMSENQAAKRLGISSTRVSELARGEWEKFSLETLITLESRIGRTVTMELAT